MGGFEKKVARISKRSRQQRWRQKKIADPDSALGSSITIHLNATEIAILDHIAIQDYATRPSTRNGRRDVSPPSRTRAIRKLISDYAEKMQITSEQIDDLTGLRRALGDFWMNERCWRASGHDRRQEKDEVGEWAVKRPKPPWNTTFDD